MQTRPKRDEKKEDTTDRAVMENAQGLKRDNERRGSCDSTSERAPDAKRCRVTGRARRRVTRSTFSQLLSLRSRGLFRRFEGVEKKRSLIEKSELSHARVARRTNPSHCKGGFSYIEG